MSSYLIDTHCHLHDQEWFTPAQAETFLEEAHANNVQQIIVIGTDPVDSKNACDFASSRQNVFWTYGIHPESASKYQNTDNLQQAVDAINQWTSDAQTVSGQATLTAQASQQPPAIAVQPPVAIGEIGLDYHYEGYDRTAQIQLFEQMLQLARDLCLPVSLHIRERTAFTDAWPILDNFPELKGVVHSFTGSKQELKKALARDFYVGVNGLATYSTLPLPPLEKMLLETDAPFLTPIPFRGTINKPGYVRNIATYLAEKLGVAEVNIVEQTSKNARELFKLRDANLC